MKATLIIGWAGHQSDTTTTMWLAHSGVRRGHDVALVDYLDLSLEPDGRVWARARVPDVPASASRERYAEALRAGRVRRVERCLSDDDLLLLRNNPADRFSTWVERVGNPGASFGRLLQAQGVRVINAPDGMERARHPGWLLGRVPDATPRTLISRDADRITTFLADLDAPAVLKPMGGYAGRGVFRVGRRQVRNVRATIELLAERGYVVAQAWIPGAERGDKRVLLWQGEPLALGDGRWSAYLRKARRGDHRHNIHAGAGRWACGLSDEELALCRRVGVHLREEGLDLVGLDLVAGRALEVNVFAPGGLHNLHALYGVDVAARIWASMEERSR